MQRGGWFTQSGPQDCGSDSRGTAGTGVGGMEWGFLCINVISFIAIVIKQVFSHLPGVGS